MSKDYPSGKPEFNQPIEYDIAEDQPIIYLNKEQDAFLARKEEAYRQRIGDPEHSQVDAKIKLAVITLLRQKGYFSPRDLPEVLQLTEEDMRGVRPGMPAKLIANAMLVIGSYNTGRPEHLNDIQHLSQRPSIVHKGMKQSWEDMQKALRDAEEKDKQEHMEIMLDDFLHETPEEEMNFARFNRSPGSVALYRAFLEYAHKHSDRFASFDEAMVGLSKEVAIHAWNDQTQEEILKAIHKVISRAKGK